MCWLELELEDGLVNYSNVSGIWCVRWSWVMSYSTVVVVLCYIRVRNWVGSHTVSVVLSCTLELGVSLVKSQYW